MASGQESSKPNDNVDGGDDDDEGVDEDMYPGRMLQQAALYNNTDFMESLLLGTERFHINEQDAYGRTPLYTSVSNNSLECAHMLLQSGGRLLLSAYTGVYVVPFKLLGVDM